MIGRTSPTAWGPPMRRGELAALVAVLAVYAWLAIRAILEGPPLGHDEAVYALRASAFVHGGDTSWFWGDHRAPGLPWLLQFVFAFGDTAPFLRLGVAALTGTGLVFTWLIGRHLTSPAVGIVAAAGVAVTPLWLVTATQIWPDGPGAALSLAVIAVLLLASSGERISWWVLLAVPLTIAATLIRYGSPITLGVAGLAILAWRRHLLRTSLPQLVLVAVGAGFPSIALIFTTWITERRSPFAATAGFVDANAPSFLDGWRGYGDMVGDFLREPSVVVLVLGVVIALAAGHRHRPAVRISLLVGTLTFAVLASTLPAEARYLAPVLPWLWIAASVGLVTVGSALQPRAAGAAGLAALVTLAFPAAGATSDVAVAAKRQFGVLKEAAAEYPWGEGCVIATTYKPQVGWYSGCRTVQLGEDGEPVIDERATHVLWVLDGKRQSETFEDWRLNAGEPKARFGDPALGPLRYVEIFDLGTSATP